MEERVAMGSWSGRGPPVVCGAVLPPSPDTKPDEKSSRVQLRALAIGRGRTAQWPHRCGIFTLRIPYVTLHSSSQLVGLAVVSCNGITLRLARNCSESNLELQRQFPVDNPRHSRQNTTM